jgi:hypothetical protein
VDASRDQSRPTALQQNTFTITKTTIDLLSIPLAGPAITDPSIRNPGFVKRITHTEASGGLSPGLLWSAQVELAIQPLIELLKGPLMLRVDLRFEILGPTRSIIQNG